ncbi:MAG: RIP metalloprotease RseP [Gammaproteobacteria bacterium]|nr:RIP metalloprotease RseP [Pseudomaricurvus alcaniphilus]MBR9911009.1 RIP metalloprotease RseP [Gammaproteobacteria bacterium]NHN37717.1 RIP metalloprotease RseP [Pseudomaricurvus alcaniphilus]
MDSVLTIIWFLVALGVLVTFHEFGHFYVARKCGVKVLRFSIGFGKPLYSWYDKSGTQYCVAGIPLGGYVKMLDEREGEVAAEELDRAFNRKNVWQRIAIVAAGPVANLILAVLLFWIMLLPGTTDIAPVIGKVEPGSLAFQAGLEANQEIIAVDGQAVATWQDLNRQLLKRLGESGTISFTVKYANSNLQYESEAQLDKWLQGVEEPDPVAGLGISLWRPTFEAIIAEVMDDSPAGQAGLAAGDRIVAIDGELIGDWAELVKIVQARPGQRIMVEYERRREIYTVPLTTRAVTTETGAQVGQIGIMPVRPEWPREMLRQQEYSISAGFVKAVHKTWDTSGFVLLSVKKLILGEISTKNLSGPITIAKVAGASAKAGANYYIGFLALLSISLGVFNLLPIPVLDGGHLFYYFIEVVKGSPVSEKIQAAGYQIGLVLVAGLMILALYNDVMRL